MENKHPRIKPHFSIIAHTMKLIELRSGVWNHVSYTLEDEDDSSNLYRFIAMLDGTRSVSEITKSLQMPRSDAEGIIDHLQKLNVLEDKSSTAFDYYVDVYAPVFKSRQHTENEVFEKNIFILSTSDLSTEIKTNIEKNTSLKNINIFADNDNLMNILKDKDESWMHNALQFEKMLQNFTQLKDSFFILAFDHINPILAKRFNRIATALNIHWIHAAIDGPFIFIGPLFESPRTACYECFETRVGMNLREYNSYQKYKTALANGLVIRQSEFPMRGLLRNLLIAHLTLEVINYMLTGCSFSKNKVLSIYLPTMEIAFNDFIKVSNCQNCGSQTHRDDHQLYFDVQGLLKEIA